MRFKISFLLLFFIYPDVFAMHASLQEMRTLYQQAVASKESCIKLLKCCNEETSLERTICLGYKGCATMMRAKHLINPFSKWSKFSTGKEMLEQAINKDSANIELRYLRFTIQTNVPSFLGYNNNISSDKKYLLESIETLEDIQLKYLIANYLVHSDYTTTTEKQRLWVIKNS